MQKYIALRPRDLYWGLATPLYYFIGVTRHEGSHAIAAILLGGRVTEFSILPSAEAYGSVEIAGGNHEWLWIAAPYACDLLIFAIGCFWLFRIPPHRRWLFDNVLAIMLISPIVDLAFNYRGIFRYTYTGVVGASDVAALAQLFGPAAVHVVFITAFLLCAVGFAFALTRTPMASRRIPRLPLDA